MSELLTDRIHDMTWGEVFALRDSKAHAYWHKHGCRFRLEEYLSEAHESIARTLKAYTPAWNRSLRTALGSLLRRSLQRVPRDRSPNGTSYGAQGTKRRYRQHVTVPIDPHHRGWEQLLHPVTAQGEARTLANEVLTDLAGRIAPGALARYVLLALDTKPYPGTAYLADLRNYGWTDADVQTQAQIEARKPHWLALPPKGE